MIGFQSYQQKSHFIWFVTSLLLGLMAGSFSNLWGASGPKMPAPVQERGFSASGEFQETVNVFSGSVNIAIPLATLRSANDFVFRLSLYYDSDVWNVFPVGALVAKRTSDLRPKPRDVFDQLDPTAAPFSWNVSPGWLVHPGRIQAVNPQDAEGASFLYFGPDHSRVLLYADLRGDDPNSPNSYFSRDGNYLRFDAEQGATGFLYAPSGTRTRFEGGWFDYVEDSFGNRVDKLMEFPQNPFDPVVMVFRENRFGREIRVGMEPTWGDCGNGPCPNPDLGLVNWVEYPAPGKTNGQPNTARITLERLPIVSVDLPEPPTFCDPEHPAYDSDACVRWIINLDPPDAPPRPAVCDIDDRQAYDEKACFLWSNQNGLGGGAWWRHLASRPPDLSCPNVGECASGLDDLNMTAGGLLHGRKLPLSRVIFPDGTFYQFKYGYMSEVDGGPQGMMSGAISEMVLPTGGTITYEYGVYRVPDNRRSDLRLVDDSEGCEQTPILCRDFWAPQMGVISRKVYGIGPGPALHAPDEVTRYRRGVIDANNIQDHQFLNSAVVDNITDASRGRSMFVVETSPLGHDTVHYYRTPEKAWDYGLPFTRLAVPQANPLFNAFPSRGTGDIGAAYLSKEFFEGPAVVNGQRGTVKRREYLAFERDVKSDNFTSSLNARVHYRRQVFLDDRDDLGNPHYVETRFSDYDGYGHYRTVYQGGSFGGADKTVTTNYNRGVGNYVVYESNAGGDSAETFVFGNGHGFAPRGNSEPWVLDTYDFVLKQGDGQASLNEFHFDTLTGKLLRKRILTNFYDFAKEPEQNRAPNDLLVRFTYDEFGELAITEKYGGDLQNNLDNTNLALLILPSTAESRVSREINYTENLTTIYLQEPATETNLFLVDQSQYERHTGLVTHQQGADGVGLATTYYPTLREASSKTGDDQVVSIDYIPNDGVNPGRVLYQQGTIKTRTHLDGMGREVQTDEDLPSGKAFRTLVYENGFLVAESNPFFTDATFTEFLDLDFLGRPTRVKTAEGKVQTLAYMGIRWTRQGQSIVTAIGGGETQAAKVIIRDALGRVVTVRQQFQDDTLHSARYRYNVHDQIVEVEVGEGGQAQVRTFSYDNRQWLQSENHPEMVVSGGDDDVHHGLYNTEGMVGEIVGPDGTQRFYYHLFGPIRRVTEVLGSSQERLLKDFFYDWTNRSSTNLSGGKLLQSRRFNYLPGEPEPIVVTRTFFYEGLSGRLSDIRLRTSTGQSFEQSITYTNQGKVQQHHYPFKGIPGLDSSVASLLFGGDAQRTINYTYQHGYLESITNLVSRLDYHPHSAFFQRIQFANGVDEEIDTTLGIVRPHRIQAKRGNQTLWDSGIYAYDGAGNVKSIGPSRFSYDRSSRLTRADTEAGGITHRQDWQHDIFGNILTFDDVAISVDPTTNRLDAATYDGRGNLLQFGSILFAYDAMGMITRFTNGTTTEKYIYDDADYRVAILKPSGFQTWSLRDGDGAVLKTYQKKPGTRHLKKVREYVYADGRLLAAYYTNRHGGTTNTERRFYHLDHLGSPRLITDANGLEVSRHDYFAYGQEILPDQGDPDAERLKFTGQERDAVDRDYFKARYYLPLDGRFMSPDPILGEAENPQSWNRYSYALNNPLKFNDPTGLFNQFVFHGATNLLSDYMLIDPFFFFQVQQLENLDHVLAGFKEFFGDLIIESVGNDALTFSLLVIDEFIPEGLSDGLLQYGTAGVGKGLKIGNTVRKGLAGAATQAVKNSEKAFKHNFKYARRVRQRGVQDPKSHNFPYSFDDEILATEPILKNNGYRIFEKPGKMLGKVVTDPKTGARTQTYKDGVFEIGVTKDGVIDHRFFRSRKK